MLRGGEHFGCSRLEDMSVDVYWKENTSNKQSIYVLTYTTQNFAICQTFYNKIE